MIQPAHARLTRWWGVKGDAPRCASRAEETVQNLERRPGLSLPQDFRLYLLHAAPKEDFWDPEDTIWWAPQRVKSIPDEYDGPIADPFIAGERENWLFFADYMLWCCAWAICCGAGERRGQVVRIGDDTSPIVARSFTEFVDTHITDAGALLQPAPNFPP
jgi:hypothetical protein